MNWEDNINLTRRKLPQNVVKSERAAEGWTVHEMREAVSEMRSICKCEGTRTSRGSSKGWEEEGRHSVRVSVLEWRREDAGREAKAEP